MRVVVVAKEDTSFTEMELPAVPRAGEIIESDKYGTFEVDSVAWFPNDEDPYPAVFLRAVE